MLNKIKAKATNIDAETKEGVICFLIEFVCAFLSVTAVMWGVWFLIKWGLGQVAVILLFMLAALPLSNAMSKKIHELRK